MSTMTTLGKVDERVAMLSGGCWDQLIPVPDIRFSSIDQINIAGEPHIVRPVAQRQIATRLGIPHNYLSKCPVELQADNLNHWIGTERNDQLFFRMDGAEVRAIFTPRYQPVDNITVMERLDAMGYGPDTRVQVALDGEFFSLSLPDASKTFKINGDKMTPGISITNSEVGLSSLSIAAFVLRLVCTNGMVSKTEVTASYRHISTKILEEFPDVMGRVGSEVSMQQAKFRLSLESLVQNPESTIAAFNRQFQIREAEEAAVNWAYPQEIGVPATMFNVVNTYTKASQAPHITAESSHRLQRVGGAILGMVK
ncbi:MAG: DUF932 domain-containing protein [Anaerolineaceae bacterium]|nr:DUF932 domain-containing protein [Anaerolineaceae bacterium]